ncbi:arsenate reductase (glutaredoxin) [Pasteurellaceae bacterium USgator11]|nr:arsenate reductase (glutaredoxin) [Pasteurellaceae bacterium USgator41]TNG93891.1 arsenate reductase (glutaredoxin) [Pasteurellaceae bacterium UScroc12]TNG96904.1 arsenate reductase (glutaredoxin) [Pasteurellaceae bacterium UScroc31]TNH02125.1 arsenate reductase (glutaredoxin) [Pasteurellaceae bacterium USgator11]
MSIKILHNPRCSKSRETLAFLENQGREIEIELYLQKRYSLAELQQLAQQLGVADVREMMRVNDELYRTLGLANTELSQTELLQAIAENPALLERPIVINGEQARIARPLEQILAIL